MLEGFGLLEVQHVKAGSGLSGGELRRLAVAAGLAKRPSLLFLDEPTTGLDSAAAAGVMGVISKLATMANTAVLCVIHQPSEAIFSKFDKVLLLSCGRTAYNGPADGIQAYFKSIGKPFPDGMSASEAALNITNRDFAADPTDVDKVLDAWKAKESLPDVSNDPIPTPPRMASAMEQLSTLTRRGIVNFTRDKTNWLGRVVCHIIVQLLIAAFIPGSDYSQSQVQMKNGGMIVMLMIFSILPAINIPFYDSEMSLLAREVREGKVNPFVYILVSGGVHLPVIAVTSLMSMLVYYGLQESAAWSTYGTSVGLLAVFILMYESLAQAFSSLGVATGMIAYMFLVDQGNTFNGIFTPIEKTEYPFKLLSFIAPSRQMLASFTYTQYSVTRDYEGTLECGPLDTDPYCLAGMTYYCTAGSPCFGRTGKEILATLEYQGYDKSENQVGWRVLVLLYYILLFKLIAVMRLYKKAVVTLPKPVALSQRL